MEKPHPAGRHHEAVLTLQSLTRRRHGLAVAVFMSGGYFGAASGALVGGWWAQNLELQWFWVMGAPALLLVALILFSGLHRYEPAVGGASAAEEPPGVGFPLVLALSTCIASANVVIMRLLPVYLVRTYGEEAQFWGGAVFFSIGMAGALGAYVWGHLSNRRGCGKLIVIAWAAGAPFLYLLFHPHSPGMVVVWGPLVGFTVGGVFPLTVVLARTARGLTQRLRLGWVIGGSWGVGELLVIAISRYIDRFAPGAVEPVAAGLGVCWWLLGLTIALGAATAIVERRRLAAIPETAPSGP